MDIIAARKDGALEVLKDLEKKFCPEEHPQSMGLLELAIDEARQAVFKSMLDEIKAHITRLEA